MELKKTPFFLLLFLIPVLLFASPFQHDLDLRSTPGSGTPILCMHGYGGSGEMLLRFLTKHHAANEPLIAFNFPDFNIRKSPVDPHHTYFGTIDELLPALYVMKKCVIDDGLSALNLYGFSAGGGAVINCLAVLNTDRYETNLQAIGIGAAEKQAILNALQNGVILLDSPLKSVEEILAFHDEKYLIVAKRYLENDLRPIDSLKKLTGLSLNVILFFQAPDEILSNRDDALFIERLNQANANGQTHVLIANQGTHSSYHSLLWDAYKKLAFCPIVENK